MNSSLFCNEPNLFNINENEKQKYLEMCKNQGKKTEADIKKSVNEVQVV
jgi:hypothetical protein